MTDVFLIFHIISRICLSISICVVRSALDEGAYFGVNGGIGSRVELNLLPTPPVRWTVRGARSRHGQRTTKEPVVAST